MSDSSPEFALRRADSEDSRRPSTFSSVPQDLEYYVKLKSNGRTIDKFVYTLKRDKPLPYSANLQGK